MEIDKSDILSLIIEQLGVDLAALEQAVAIARDTATHSDCLGSSKYETMGLEASYLAQGQGTRLLEIQRSLEYFKRLRLSAPLPVIALSSLVELEDEAGVRQLLWIAPESGGLKIHNQNNTIIVITPKSPLGRTLIGKEAGDSFEMSIAGKVHCYEIIAVS